MSVPNLTRLELPSPPCPPCPPCAALPCVDNHRQSAPRLAAPHHGSRCLVLCVPCRVRRARRARRARQTLLRLVVPCRTETIRALPCLPCLPCLPDRDRRAPARLTQTSPVTRCRVRRVRRVRQSVPRLACPCQSWINPCPIRSLPCQSLTRVVLPQQIWPRPSCPSRLSRLRRTSTLHTLRCHSGSASRTSTNRASQCRCLAYPGPDAPRLAVPSRSCHVRRASPLQIKRRQTLPRRSRTAVRCGTQPVQCSPNVVSPRPSCPPCHAWPGTASRRRMSPSQTQTCPFRSSMSCPEPHQPYLMR